MTRYVRLLRNGVILGAMTLGLATCTNAPTAQQISAAPASNGVFIQTPADTNASGNVSDTLKGNAASLGRFQKHAESTTAVQTSKEELSQHTLKQVQMSGMCEH